MGERWGAPGAPAIVVNILETERTVVDRITLNDAPFFVDLVNSPDWLRYIGDRDVSSVDDARRFLSAGFLKSYIDNEFGYYIVRTASDRAPIGICGFLKKPTLQNPDFGFALLPKYYGQGFATESCRAVLNFGIHAFGFTVLDAVTRPDNLRSTRLLTKLDFKRHGLVQGDTPPDKLALYRWQIAV